MTLKIPALFPYFSLHPLNRPFPTQNEGGSKMDPISTALIAAIAAGVTDTGRKAFSDAYQGLKRLIQSKFGMDNKISKTIAEVEAEPELKGQQLLLTERITAVKADKDEEILTAAMSLSARIKQVPGGERHIMNARGNFIAQADRGSTATITVHK